MSVLFQIIFFATLGVASEVVYTSLKKLCSSITKQSPVDRSLSGESYIWMLPIYGAIPLIAPYVISLTEGFPVMLRMSCYAAIILLIEYVVGFMLRVVLGKVPREYDSGLHLHGLIRIDYFPLWMLFAYLLEFLYLSVI